MAAAATTTMWFSGRKLSVVGLYGDEASIRVPVSAIAASAQAKPTESSGSAWPRRTPRSGSSTHGIASSRGSGAATRRLGRL